MSMTQTLTRDESLTQTEFLERIYLVLYALRQGDLSAYVRPWDDELCDKVGRALNDAMSHMTRVISEVRRIQTEIGHLGQLGPQAEVAGAHGDWKRMLDMVNLTAANYTNQIRNFNTTLLSLERGDASARATAECHGELRQLRDTINRLMERVEKSKAAAAV